jgi:hypothetical protein
VFVAPNHQVEPAGNDLLHDARLLGGAQCEPLILVLVENQNVEPTLIDLAFVVDGPFELDLSAFERDVQPLVLHVADSEESDAGAALREQNWLHCELFYVGYLAEVVNVVIAAELVKGAELLQTHRIIMVAVD